MIDEILINDAVGELRAALREGGATREIAIERHARPSLLGNVYLGRVTALVPGLGAAFVDIGEGREGFLPRIGHELYDMPYGARLEPSRPVTEGEAILVQVTKDAIGDKGPRLTLTPDLPGHHLVLTPESPGLRLSRRVTGETGRNRLRQIGEAVAAIVAREAGRALGLIVRTEAAHAPEELIRAEAMRLGAAWRRILEEARGAQAPACLRREIPPVSRILRDYATRETARLVIDTSRGLSEARKYAADVMPFLASRIALHRGAGPLFGGYGVEDEIDEALSPQVTFEGGMITIETTRALTAIDVDSASASDGGSLEATALRVNLAAAARIAREVRLRAIGGIIAVDFIDMAEAEHRRQVVAALTQALADDAAPARVAGMSPFGVVEFTRRRDREPWMMLLTEPSGPLGGRRFTAETIGLRILRAAEAEARRAAAARIEVRAAPEIAAWLEGPGACWREAASRRASARLDLVSDPALAREAFRVAASPIARRAP